MGRSSSSASYLHAGRPAPLSVTTVRRTHGPHAPTWHHPRDFGLHVEHSSPPPIGVVATENADHVAGRFFPRVRYAVGANRSNPYIGPVLLVYRHHDEAITRATIVHELAHFASYCEECSHVPRTKQETVRCRYKGEHDAEFYKRLEPMYRAADVPTYAARAVEGTYDYPEHWKKDAWPT